MGYRSYFKVKLDLPIDYIKMAESLCANNKSASEYILDKFTEIVQYSFSIGYETQDTKNKRHILHLYHEDAIKWYEADDDVIKLSNLFQGAVITIECDGENDDDFWELICKNGEAIQSLGSIQYWNSEDDRKERDRILALSSAASIKGFISQ